MIKNILVPASGSEKDLTVFKTAFEVAQMYHGHLAFYHVHISAGEALAHESHAQFARGEALKSAFDELGETHDRRTMLAEHHVRNFCSQFKIKITDTPLSAEAITASWRGGDSGNGEDRLVSKARGYDLVVMGRFTHPNGLPSDLLQLVLVGCGRPVLIAANNAPQTLTGTVMVCWKDAPEAARAVSVAMPFLAKADRVVIVTVGEGKKSVADSAHAVASQLAWHRVEATAEVASTDGLPVAQVLLSAAQKCRADLLVMGGYSKGRMRETIFGGCTDSILRKADIPVLMLH